MAANGAVIDVRLCTAPIEVPPWGELPQPTGGECVFLGRTRAENHPVHGALHQLSYEAYAPMAERVLNDLARVAADRFSCRAVRIHHALGVVPVGEASVMVQVLTNRRAEAFDACRFLIDALKAQAPIWKREVWADATTWSMGAPVKIGGTS